MSLILLGADMVHYEALGRGRPLIFLHGWVGSWRYWIPVMQAASISFRAYALDLWGFGGSARRAELYSLDQQVILLDGYLKQMGIGKVALIGHGLGALVGLRYAQLYPGDVDRLMAVGCPMNESMLNPRLHTAAPAELTEWLLGHTPLYDAVRLDAPGADPAAVTASLSSLSFLEKQLSKFKTPCVLVNGQNDPLVEVPQGEQQLMLPDTTHTVVFEGSRHFPMLDESSKFNRLMVDFLALPPGTSPRELQLKEEWKRRVR